MEAKKYKLRCKKINQMEQLTDYQTQRIEALERENAKLQSQLNEAKEILTQLLKDLQDGNRLEEV